MLTTVQVAIAALVGIALAGAFLVFSRRRAQSSSGAAPLRPKPEAEPAPWAQFDGETCRGASLSLLQIAGTEALETLNWQTLRSALLPRFPDLPQAPPSPAGIADQPLSFQSVHPQDTAVLLLRAQADGLELTLTDQHQPDALDRHNAMALMAVVATRDAASDKLPHPIWATSGDGALIWSNKPYRDLQQSLQSVADSQASPFTGKSLDALDREASARVSLTLSNPSEDVHWFDVSSTEIGDDMFVHCAVNVDGLIAAETAQRQFVQTLAKTFAQLSTGLAIFDRDRRLALFNPALVDLTSLPAHFLSGQPNIQNFFDRLRDNRIMPEPKDYSSWRRQIADLVVQSEGGRYQEVWRLPSGLTYRIVGRPHPDGAIAILIEDISVEISLTQRFTGQIELGQSALDMQGDAIVAFDHSGAVLMWNRAFLDFIGLPLEAEATAHRIPAVLRLLKDKLTSGPARNALSSLLHSSTSQSGFLTLKDGRSVPFTTKAHEGNSTIVTLALSDARAAEKPVSKSAAAG